MNKKKISTDDAKTWDNFVKDPKNIFDKDGLKGKINPNFLRFKFDLHGFSLNEANTRISEVILSCVKKKYKEVLIITGKGIHSNSDQDVYASKDLSKLRYSVPEYIKSNQSLSKYILSVESAAEKDGGEGAIVVKLKNL